MVVSCIFGHYACSTIWRFGEGFGNCNDLDDMRDVILRE